MTQTFNALTNIAQGGDELEVITREEKSSSPLKPTTPGWL